MTQSISSKSPVPPHPSQQGQRMYLLPMSAEEIQAAKVYDGALLHCHHWVHLYLLHHHVVWCCNCQGQVQTTAYYSLCRKSDRMQSPVPPGPACLQYTDTSRNGHELPLPLRIETFGNTRPPAKGWGLSRIKPCHATTTVFPICSRLHQEGLLTQIIVWSLILHRYTHYYCY